MREDLYQVLGVKSDCSYDEIKTAYRKLALKFHPDVNQNDKYFEERFKEVQEAYEILSHPDKRNEYNLKNGFNQHARQGSQNRNNYSTPASLAEHVEKVYRKVKMQTTAEVNKTQLTAFFDSVLKESLVTQLVKIADIHSNERIVHALIPLFRFLTPGEVNKYTTPLARLAGANNDLIIEIHLRAKEQVRSERSKNLLQLFKAILVILVVAVFIVSVTDNEDGSAKSTAARNYDVPVHPITPISRFKGNQLRTGDSPYNNLFGKGVYSRSYLNQLEVKNGQDLDVIVCLTDYYSRKTVRNEYIRAGDSFLMTNIPNGTYFLKSFYGKDWNPDTVLFAGTLKGYFDSTSSFTKSDDYSDLIRMSQTAEKYSTYTVTLYRVPGGNMESQDILPNEFFR